MKKIDHRLLLLLLAVVVTGCGSVRQHVAEKPLREKTLHILAVNDMHAAIDNFPRLAFMVDSLRALYPDLLLVSGGDNQTGNPVNDQYPEKGWPMIRLMNALKFDISAVGNHEFDTGKEGFPGNVRKADFDFICANVSPPAMYGHLIKPYKIMRAAHGLRVAFTSVISINSGQIPDTHPDNVKGYTFGDPLAKANEMLFLRDSCDILVYLNHYGFEDDAALARQFPAGVVDLIIGGHSHTKVAQEQFFNGILVTQAENKLKYATLITLTTENNRLKKAGMKLLTVGNKGNENREIKKMVEELNSTSHLDDEIAHAESHFTAQEMLGYLMADALRAGARTDIAIVNPGGIRMDKWPKGKVTTGMVYELDPFGNEMVVLQLKGSELCDLYLSAFELDERRPLVAAGLYASYTLNRDGSLADVELFTSDKQPIDTDKTYSVAINSYMAAVYRYEHEDKGTSLSRSTAENMIQYLREMKRIPSYENEKRLEVNRL
ncbi:MAG: bifunctional UDP-sugar hydrolase/5'-nucleotidase [Prevotella sp.]|nr:bifunctional metallophosphatase/5'-nucleotidase [Prevotella sp.]MDY6130838.1 bifunctional UDP-sugar hydrolase/5'-nucleotidase [Prevotella sp.]